MLKRVQELIDVFQMQSHPEGGWFSEFYTSDSKFEQDSTLRGMCGSIYFMLAETDISHFHQIDCEELWQFHEGCGLLIHIIGTDGQYRRESLGLNYQKGEKPVVLLRKGEIFAAENIDCEGYTFISCVTAPKFKYEGFRLVPRAELKDMELPEKLFI